MRRVALVSAALAFCLPAQWVAGASAAVACLTAATGRRLGAESQLARRLSLRLVLLLLLLLALRGSVSESESGSESGSARRLEGRATLPLPPWCVAWSPCRAPSASRARKEGRRPPMWSTVDARDRSAGRGFGSQAVRGHAHPFRMRRVELFGEVRVNLKDFQYRLVLLICQVSGQLGARRGRARGVALNPRLPTPNIGLCKLNKLSTELRRLPPRDTVNLPGGAVRLLLFACDA